MYTWYLTICVGLCRFPLYNRKKITITLKEVYGARMKGEVQYKRSDSLVKIYATILNILAFPTVIGFIFF